MRTLFITLASALALVAGGAAAAPILNQLDNGGFEEYDADNDPAEWRVITGDANPTSDNTEGDNATQINFVADEKDAVVGQRVSLDRQDAPIVPNTDYDLAFDAKLDTSGSLGFPTDASANATVVWKNALGEPVDEDTVAITAEVYTSHDVTFTAPADATEAEVQFELVRPSTTSSTNALLKVDAAAFGPSGP